MAPAVDDVSKSDAAIIERIEKYPILRDPSNVWTIETRHQRLSTGHLSPNDFKNQVRNFSEFYAGLPVNSFMVCGRRMEKI